MILINASSIEKANEWLAKEIVKFDAIVVGACSIKDRPTTPPLVRDIRKTFTGPIIATTGAWDQQRELMEAGCDYAFSRDVLPNELIRILGLQTII